MLINIKKYIISKSEQVLSSFRWKLRPNRLLLVRLDAIGDYILFRNYIQVLKESKKFRNYSITLLGNIIWKDIAETYDSKYIDEFIWVDKKKILKENGVYEFAGIIRFLAQKRFKIIIHPTYSREFFFGDLLISFLDARKIGHSSDRSNISAKEKARGDKLYNTLIQTTQNVVFEFYRNKSFFEQLLNKQITIQKPYLDIIQIKADRKYVVLFPGATHKFRRWNNENFIELTRKILIDFSDISFIIAGGESEVECAQYIHRQLNSSKVINKAGATSLSELIVLISNASLLISNETGVVHIAAATNIPTVCISNANHFGRFNPYPIEMVENIYTIYPLEIEKRLTQFEDLVKEYSGGSDLDINSISVERVYQGVQQILLKKE